MVNMPINLIVSLLFLIVLIGGGIFIQILLSRSENKFLGLILPILSLLISISIILGRTAFNVMVTESVDGVVQSTNQLELKFADYLGLFFSFLLLNIPTALLGVIYLGERNKIKVKKSIEKMIIEDL